MIARTIADIPWMFVWVGALLSFAATSGGVLWFIQTAEKFRIKDRLLFEALRVGRNINGPGMFLGATLVNTASIPIEFEVEEIRTKINNVVPAKTTFELPNITIPPNSGGWFDDHVIAVNNPPKPGTLEGFADFKLKYGSPGSLKYTLHIKKQVILAFNDQGIFAGASWNDAK